jgi:hypothetical protein
MFGEYWCHGDDQLEVTFVKLCGQLKPLLETGRYSVIVGDDASGRLPTLGIREYSNYVLQAAGKDPLPTVFLQNKPNAINVEDVNTQIEKRVLPFAGDEGRALYVTEYVEEGRNIYKIRGAFQNHGVNFDIAALELNGWDNKTHTGLDFLQEQNETLVIEGERVTRRSPLLKSYVSGLSVFSCQEDAGLDKRGNPAKQWVRRLNSYAKHYEGEDSPQRWLIMTAIKKARIDVHTWVQKAIAQTYPQE